MTNCATPAELLLVVFADPSSGAPDNRSDHIGRCSTCTARLEELRARTASLATTPRVANAHLDDFTFAEVAGASRMRELADAAVAHLADCEPCRREQAEIVRLLRDPRVRAELDRDRPLSVVAGGSDARVTLGGRSRCGRASLPRIAAAGLAAAAAVFITVRAVRTHPAVAETPSALRHAMIDVAHASLPVAPLGEVRHVDAMVWTSVPHADLYRVSIFDRHGRVVWESEVSDTTASPPGHLLEQISGELRWRVKARTSFDQWIDSDFAEFTLKGDR